LTLPWSLSNESFFFEDNSANTSSPTSLPTSSPTSSPTTLEDTATFFNNSANIGGAVKIAESTKVLVQNNNFVGNRALVDAGGAIDLKEVENTYIYKNRFTENSALRGGALTFDSLVSTSSVLECTFTNNVAKERGGAMSAAASNGKGFNGLTANAVYVKNSSMVGNCAPNGGAISLQIGNAFAVMDSAISEGIADNGGAIFVDTLNHLSLKRVTMTDNVANANGGAVYIAAENEMKAEGVVMNSNVASNLGGGLFSDDSRVHIDESTFIDNSASHSGGACSFAGSSTVVFEEGATAFIRNTAPYAAAIDFGQSLTSIEIADSMEAILLEDNTCLSGGGVVYFTRDAGNASSIPNIFNSGVDNSDRVIYGDNSVNAGGVRASQSVSLTIREQFDYSDYTAPLAPMTITMLDHYGNTNTSDSRSVAEVSIEEFDCSGKTAFLTGQAREVAFNGSFTFSELSASCFPEGHVILRFDITLDGLGTDYALNTTTRIDFSKCQDGDTVSENQCLACSNGTFSLTFIGEDTTCEVCPSNTETCYRNSVSSFYDLFILITSY
jgi:predicted outer membrane repeat protein